MRTAKALIVVALAALTISPIYGADLVGKAAPGFVVEEDGIVNEAPALDLKDMKGEVILIKYWGTK